MQRFHMFIIVNSRKKISVIDLRISESVMLPVLVTKTLWQWDVYIVVEVALQVVMRNLPENLDSLFI